jgi:hypothetical protein
MAKTGTGKKRKSNRLFTRKHRRGRVNRKYKDILFDLILTDKKALLTLYNALNGTDYDREADLTINTLEDAVYLGYKNDLSFLINNTINLYEHQSTLNPNMPLRGLRYMATLYDDFIVEGKKNEYGTKLIKLPYPQCIVFYNGIDFMEERKTLRLSDAYYEAPHCKHPPCLEFTVTVLNINYGNNQELLSKCRELGDYAYFIHLVRRYLASGIDLEEAVRQAIDDCIEQDVLKEIFMKSKRRRGRTYLSEFDTNFNEKTFLRVRCDEAREDGYEEGRTEGLAEARIIVARNLLKRNRPIEEIVEDTGLTRDEIESLSKEITYGYQNH